MSRRVKELVIDEVRNRIGDCAEFLVVNSSRLDPIADNRFRLGLREKDIKILTVKNSLAKKALHDAGIIALDPILEGPSTLVWGSEDAVTLSKAIAKWVKDIGELEFKGGIVEGKTLSAEDVDALSKSPSREELIGRIALLALSPGARLVSALLGPGGKLCGQVKSIAEKEGEQ